MLWKTYFQRITGSSMACCDIRMPCVGSIFRPTVSSLEKARAAVFVYQELLVLQLGLAIRRAQQQSFRRAPVFRVSLELDKRIRRLFPFEFTAGQNQAIQEICADLSRPIPMLRLLHGDVGCGKTVVAAYAMLVAIAHGYQAALMTPTEVRGSSKHMRTFERLLAFSRVRRLLLTGGLSPRERAEALAKIAAGEVGSGGRYPSPDSGGRAIPQVGAGDHRRATEQVPGGAAAGGA